MKDQQLLIRRILSLLLSLTLIFSQGSFSVLAEDKEIQPTETAEEIIPATPTDLDPSREALSYEQTETIGNVRFTVTAEPGVFKEGTRLTINSENGTEELKEAAETALDAVPSDTLITRHAFYTFSGAEMNGAAKVKVIDPAIAALKEEYPDGTISVSVLACHPDVQILQEKAQIIPSVSNTDQSLFSFDLSEQGLIDFVAVIRLQNIEAEEETDKETETEEQAEASDETTTETTKSENTEALTDTSTEEVTGNPGETTEGTPDKNQTEDPGLNKADEPEYPEQEEADEIPPATPTDLAADPEEEITEEEIKDLADDLKETSEQDLTNIQPEEIKEETVSPKAITTFARSAMRSTIASAPAAGSDEGTVSLLSAPANPRVLYEDPDGTEQPVPDYTIITSETTAWNASANDGWYVVNGNTTIPTRVSVAVNSTVRVVLTDESELSIPKGIYVPSGSQLQFYRMSGKTGKLTITNPDSGYAGIGGNPSGSAACGTIVIYGGIITVKGGEGAAAIGGASGKANGRIDIFNGTITATVTGSGAAIGGGSGGSGNKINISGGTVIATAGNGGAGIGGGYGALAGTISITGGTVTASGGIGAAGIGSGVFQNAGGSNKDTIVISGGCVTATGGSGGGAGIGGGKSAMIGKITISGGVVSATGNGGPGIGPGQNATEGKVILSWVEEVYESMTVTANSYGGTVNLNSDFVRTNTNPTKVLWKKTDFDKTELQNSVIAPYADRVRDWVTLQEKIRNSDSDEEIVITLGKDITAAATDNSIEIPSGKRVILELNGHTLSRGLTSSTENGNVITIRNGAALTVRDTSKTQTGKITGGFNRFREGGGIKVYGNLSLESGTICGNKAYYTDAGAVYLASGASFTMTGGTISDNHVTEHGQGAGVYVEKGSTFNMSGGSIINNSSIGYDGGGVCVRGTMNLSGGRISGNKTDCAGGGIAVIIDGVLNLSLSAYIKGNSSSRYGTDNLYLGTGASFYIHGELNPDTEIGVKYGYTNGSDYVRALTKNSLERPEDYQYFTADFSKSAVYFNENKQLVHGQASTVSFQAEDGTGEMKSVRAVKNNIYVLPENEYAPKNKNLNFAGWRVGNGSDLKQPGDTIKLTGNTTLTACFGMPYEDENGKEKSAYTYSFVNYGLDVWEDGWYVVDGDERVGSRVTVSGAVFLILKDGATLEAAKGISVTKGSSLTIYAQKGQTGKLDCTEDVDRFCAAIGGEEGKETGTIIICGGNIDAKARNNAAGIGGSNTADAGKVIIRRGTVNAQGGSSGAGIGGGFSGNGTVTITGGTVIATGGGGSAGIGGGFGGKCEVTISGGTVTATGGDVSDIFGRTTGGAGIGSGTNCFDLGTITITGGTVTARGNQGGSGIGPSGVPDGYDSFSMTEHINIYGGVIYAYGSNGQPGIGCNQPTKYGVIRVGWTEDSKKNMRVYTDRYDSLLRFQSSFLGDPDGIMYVPDIDYRKQKWPVNQTIVPAVGAYNWATLQQCINAASYGETIKVYANCIAEDNDTALEIAANKKITIDLNGHSLYRFVGGRQELCEGGNVIKNYGDLTIIGDVENSVIFGGDAIGSGGGIYNEGTLRISGVRIRNNLCTDQGGAVYNLYGSVKLKNCEIYNNTASNRGGAIANLQGTMEIDECSIHWNNTTNSDSLGGAIYTSDSSARLTVTNTEIYVNTAGMSGGGLYISGTRTTIKDSSVRNNTAKTRDDGKGGGGGIYIIAANVTIDDTAITGNNATSGGGLYLNNQSTVTLEDSVEITGNKAVKGDTGGGIEVPDKTVKLNISGKPVVRENTSGSATVNLRLATQCTLLMAGALEEGASVGVMTTDKPTSSQPLEFTSKLIQAADKNGFTSDDPNYIVDAKANGGAVLGVPVKISYYIGQNVGSKADTWAVRGNNYVLEDCKDFDEKIPGLKFRGWIVNNTGNWQSPGTPVDPGDSLHLTAVFSVPYIALDGSTQTKDCVIFSDSMTGLDGQHNYGYAVIGKVTRNGDLDAYNGKPELVLCDGCNLTVTRGIITGVYVADRITFWGQEKQNGQLNVTAPEAGEAGIGAAYSLFYNNNGTICINGGTITAQGGNSAAGIGGGYRMSGGHIIINRGTVNATGGPQGAGIGGGSNAGGGKITINGGTINASSADHTFDESGAGIGGGYDGSGGSITINGGTLNARNGAGNLSAAIGSGFEADNSGDIRINGGTVTATTQGDKGAAIGAGGKSRLKSVTITGGKVTAISEVESGYYGTCIGAYNYQTGTVTISGGDVTTVQNSSYVYGICASAVTLTWTEESKNTTRYTIGKIGYCNATLQNRFCWAEDETTVLPRGTLSQDDQERLVNGRTIIPCETLHLYTWKSVVQAIDESDTSPVTLKLEADIKAEADDTRILIDGGRNIILDLNGHRMDRNAALRLNTCNVITVESGSSLTIRDSTGGGVIEKGNSSSSGGAIVVNGELTLEGGTISNNYSYCDGGAIEVKSGARMTMTGGTIEGNIAEASAGAIRIRSGATVIISGGRITANIANNYHGGAIYNNGSLTLGDVTISANTAKMQGGAILEAGTLNIQGLPVIRNNTAPYGDNVYLRPDKVMHVTGKLDEEAEIHVTAEKAPPVTLTDALRGKGTAENFISDNDEYYVLLNAEEEAILGQGVKITFDPGEGKGTAFSKYVAVNSEYTLPECPFTREGSTFDCWTVNGNPVQSPYKVTGATTFVAAYKNTIYDVWVNNIQVTDANKADILGDGGKAKYDATTKILTLNGAVITDGTTGEDIYGIEFEAGIYATEDLTVRGTVTIYTDSVGIRSEESITLDGLNATIHVNGDMALSGIRSAGSISVKDSRITTDGGDSGLEADGEILIQSSSVDARSMLNPVYAGEDIVINGDSRVYALKLADDFPSSAIEAGYQQTIRLDTALAIILPADGRISQSTVTDQYGMDVSEALIAKAVRVTGIRIEPESDVMLPGDTLQMKAYIEPEDAANTFVKWSSSAAGVAEVDENGLLTAVEKGTAYITVASQEDKDIKATATIKVNAAIPSYGISIGKITNGTVALPEGVTSAREGEEIQLTVTPLEGYHLTRLYYVDEAGKEQDISIKTATFKMPNRIITICADFVLNTFTVHFDANGGSGSMDDMQFIWGTAKNLSANKFTLKGSQFAGWGTAADGGAVYEDKASVKNLTAENDATVTLYAIWTTPTYTLNVVTDSTMGSVTVSKTSNVKENEPITIVPHPEDGYAVKSVTYTPAGGSTVSISETQGYYRFGMPAANVTVRVLFEAKQYKLTFDAKGGTFASGQEKITGDVAYGTAISSPADPVREGYDFLGWEEGPALPATMPAKDLTYTAAWKIREITLTFVVLDPSDPSPAESVHTVIRQEYNTLLTPPEKPIINGYTFTAWNPALPARIPAEDAKYTAQWSRNSYSITFDANGGKFSDNTTVKTQTLEYGEAITAPDARTLTRDGYTFAGWDATVPGTMPADNLRFKARWQVAAYRITIQKAENGKIWQTPSKTTYTADETVTVVVKPEDGYRLKEGSLCYRKTGESTTTIITETAGKYTFTMPAASIRLEAEFEPIHVTGISVNPSSIALNIQDTITIQAYVEPSNALNQKVSWVSSNTSIATVDQNGFVTAVAVGECDIKATTEDNNKTAVCHIRIPADKYSVIIPSVQHGSVTANKIDYGELETVTLNTVPDEQCKLTSLGYSYTDAGGSIVTIPLEINPSQNTYTFVMPASIVTVSAAFTVNQYKISFDTDGGNSIDDIILEYGTTIVPPANPEKEGYTFIGWDPVIPETMPATDTVCKANWRINQYTIDFEMMGGTPQLAKIQADYGTEIPKPQNPTKEGYQFIGWDPDPWGSADTIPMPAKNQTLTAKWSVRQYTIVLKVDDEVYKTIRQDYGSTVVSPADPRKEGYTFAGWIPELPATMPVVTDANSTYTASWSTNSYTMTFEANGGLFNPGTDQEANRLSSLERYGTKLTIPGPLPERTGYTISGWKPEFSDTTTVPAADTTYSAQWTANDYLIDQKVLPAGSGEITLYPDKVNQFHINDPVTVYAKPAKGYRFVSLAYVKKGETAETEIKAADGVYSFAMPAANISVKALFDPISVENVFIEATEREIQVGNTLQLTAIIWPSDALNRKVTWSSSDDSIAAVDENGKVTGVKKGKAVITVTTEDGGHTDTYRIEVINDPDTLYDIVINPSDHGKVTTDTSKSKAGNDIYLEVTPEEGYSLKSLEYSYDKEKGSIPIDLNNPVIIMPEAPITITATFTVNFYTFRFNTAGGTPVASITLPYGSAVNIPADPTKTGYTFFGWNDAIPSIMPAYDMSFVARWTVNSYTITFDTDGGNEIAPITLEYGSAVTAPQDPEKTGSVFIGWNRTVPDTMPAEDITLKAIWRINQYTITFRSFGGLIGTITANYGADITPPSNPTAKGYGFAGWEPAVPKTMPEENMVIRAVWTPIDYYVIPICDPATGTVSASVWDAQYGETVTITALPYDGYKLGELTVYTDGDPILPDAADQQNGLYEFTMPACHVIIYATFITDIERDFKVGIADTSGGKVVADRTEANVRETVCLNAYPEAGYRLTEKSLHYTAADGSEITADTVDASNGKYSFVMPNQDVTVSAQFEKKTYTVSVDDQLTAGVTITPDPASASIGDLISVAVTIPEDCKLDILYYTAESGSMNQVSADENGNYSFTMPAEDIRINARITGIPVEGVAIRNAPDMMHVGETARLTAVISPANALNRNVIWISSNPDVATVDADGRVTATGTGYVTITAVTENGGYRAECEFVVEREIVTINFEKGIDDSFVTGTMEPVRLYQGDEYRLPNHRYDIADTVPEGFSFTGWRWRQGRGDDFQYGFPGTKIEVMNDLTLTAVWGYAVQIDETENGTVTASPAGGMSGTQITLTAIPDPGYRMPAAITVNGETKSLDQNGTYTFSMPSASVSVSAEFVPITYSLQYHANYPDGSDEIKAHGKDLAYDELFTLEENPFNIDGYRFTGWNTEADGTGTPLRDQQKNVSKLTDADGGKSYLYAQWKKETYAFSLYSEHGQITADPEESELEFGSQVKLSVKADPGYTLDSVIVITGNLRSWGILEPDAEGNYLFSMPAGNASVLAVFTPNRYTVVFDPNAADASGEMEPQIFHYDEEQELNANAFTREGYTFVQWDMTVEDGEDGEILKGFQDGETVLNLTEADSVTLKARWKRIINNVSLLEVGDDQGNIHGKFTLSDSTAGSGEKVTITADPEDGYELGALFGMSDNWQFFILDKPDDDGTYSFIMPESNVYFFAYFQGGPYTVTFDANGGEGDMDPQEFRIGEEQNLAENTYTRAHYEFRWWNTKADGTGEPYSNMQRVKDLFDENKQGITLYALWKPLEYTVIFMDGETELDRITDAYGTAITAPEDPEKEGYTFAGWDPEAPETMPETPEEGLVIRAIWKVIETPTPTPTPTLTPTATAAPTATPTSAPTEKPTPTSTIPASTPAPTAAPTPTPTAKPTATPTATPTKKPGGGGGTAKKTVSVPVAILRGMPVIRTGDEAESAPELRDDMKIQMIRTQYGKDFVMLIGSLDADALSGIEPTDEMSAAQIFSDLIRKAEYDALIPNGTVFAGKLASLCTELAENEVPILAANIYYDGTDGIHMIGESIFTPYTVITIDVDGHPHRIGILGLFNTHEEPSEGMMFRHPDNSNKTLAGEAAFWLPKMREEGCEFIIACCFGDPEENEEGKEDEEEKITPAEQMIRECTGIDLLIEKDADSDEITEETIQDRNGKKVYLLCETEELEDGVFLFTHGNDGKLTFSLSKGGLE